MAQRPALLLPSLDPQLPGSCPTNQTMGTIGNGKGLKIGLNKKMKQFFLCMIQVLDPVGTYAILSIKVVEKPGRAQKKIQSGREVQPE